MDIFKRFILIFGFCWIFGSLDLWIFGAFGNFRCWQFMRLCQINQIDWVKLMGLRWFKRHAYQPSWDWDSPRNQNKHLNFHFFSCHSSVVSIVIPRSFRSRCPEPLSRATGPPVRLGDIKEWHNLSFQCHLTVIPVFGWLETALERPERHGFRLNVVEPKTTVEGQNLSVQRRSENDGRPTDWKKVDYVTYRNK